MIVPFVLGPSGVPEVIDEARAEADPELAVLSAMAHGKDADTAKSVRIAAAAQLASLRLDADRATRYFDSIMHSLSEAACKVLQTMNPAKYEYRTDFAKHCFSKGKAAGGTQGERSGRVALITRLLTVRFGNLPDTVHSRIAAASIDELDVIGERLLMARTLPEALGDLR